MASAAYELTIDRLLNGDVAFDTDTLKARLGRSSGYTFSQAHDFMDDTTAAIVSDVTLGSKTVANGVFDAADATFTAFTAGAALDYVILHLFHANDAGSFPWLYLDGFSVTPNGGDITLVWAAASPKIFRIAA